MTTWPDEYCLVITSVPSNTDLARELALSAVKSKLAACVNQMTPSISYYEWNDEIHSDSEVLLLMKTLRCHVKALTALIQEKHTYDLPEIIVLPIIDGLPAYLNWISANTNNNQPS